MLSDLTKRLQVVLGSVLFFLTALAVAVNELVAQVAPELPAGWQDNAVRVGAAVVSVIGLAAAAIRRVTTVPAGMRGLNQPDVSAATWQAPDGGVYTYRQPGNGTVTGTSGMSITRPAG